MITRKRRIEKDNGIVVVPADSRAGGKNVVRDNFRPVVDLFQHGQKERRAAFAAVLKTRGIFRLAFFAKHIIVPMLCASGLRERPRMDYKYSYQYRSLKQLFVMSSGVETCDLSQKPAFDSAQADTNKLSERY